jgi:hypothetical protein
VAALEPEVVVELDTELEEVANPGRRLSGERRDRARARQAATREQRVLRVELGRVVVADRSCDAALRERARRREQRALRDESDSRVGCSAERGEETGDASTDDQEVDRGWCRAVRDSVHARFSTQRQ